MNRKQVIWPPPKHSQSDPSAPTEHPTCQSSHPEVGLQQSERPLAIQASGLCRTAKASIWKLIDILMTDLFHWRDWKLPTSIACGASKAVCPWWCHPLHRWTKEPTSLQVQSRGLKSSIHGLHSHLFWEPRVEPALYQCQLCSELRRALILDDCDSVSMWFLQNVPLRHSIPYNYTEKTMREIHSNPPQQGGLPSSKHTRKHRDRNANLTELGPLTAPTSTRLIDISSGWSQPLPHAHLISGSKGEANLLS